MIDRYFTALPLLKEYIVLRGSKVGNYTLEIADIDNIVVWYFDNLTKILTVLPKTKYSINFKKKTLTITDDSLPSLDNVIITIGYNKQFINLLADFTMPDFSFLKNLNIPTYNSSYVNKWQLVPKYSGNTILDTIVYSSDIYKISQNNNLLTGANNEPYSTIAVSNQYTDFFTWYNQKTSGATALYNYYIALIDGLNDFITNSPTLSGLTPPITITASTNAILLMGTDFDTTMENVIRPLYQYQIDYYNKRVEIINNEYIEPLSAIDRVVNFNPDFNDIVAPILDSVIKINDPVFDSISGRYLFSGISQEGVEYNRLDSSAIQDNLSYAKWKEYYDDGSANSLLFHRLVIPSTTYDIDYLLTIPNTQALDWQNTSVLFTNLSGFPTIDLYDGSIDFIAPITLTAGKTILLTNRTNKAENGPWVIQSGSWARPSWFAGGSVSQYGGINFNILNSLTIGDSGEKWILETSGDITVDTTELSIKQISTLKDSVIRSDTLFNIIDNSLTVPPLLVGESDSYVVPAGATGAWAGQANKIAYSLNGGKDWYFYSPNSTQKIIISSGININNTYQWDGTSWAATTILAITDTDSHAKSQQFDTFANNSKRLYDPLVSNVQKIFNDYSIYIGTAPPITQMYAMQKIITNNGTVAQTVYDMVADIIEVRSGVVPVPYNTFLLNTQKPLFVKYEYFIIDEKKPFYLKGNTRIPIFENTELEFGDYCNMVSNPDVFLYGQNGEQYDSFINKVQYDNFKNYYITLSNYIGSILTDLNTKINNILTYTKAVNIEFNGLELRDKIIYNLYNLDFILLDIKVALANSSLIMTDEITANQSLDKLFNNISHLYQNFLLSLKIEPLCINKINTIAPSFPDNFEQNSYSLIQRYNKKKDSMVHDWGASIDNTVGGTYNQKLIDFLNLKGGDKDIYINFYNQRKISDYRNDYLHFFVGEISSFATRNGKWHIADGTLFDKRVNSELYNNLVDKITVQATQGSNQYVITSQTKGYLLESNTAIFSKDNIFNNANISSFNSGILALDQISSQNGIFELEYLNYFGAKINSINNNMFNIPNITEDVCIGVNLDNANYGFFTGNNEHQMLDSQMPQINIKYQSDYANGTGVDFCGGSYVSCNYRNTTVERVTKKAQTNIDLKQKQVSIGKFYIRIE